jgi:hypothetical protein
MTDENQPAFESYPCSLGTVIGHEADEHGSIYLIAQPDGQTVGVLANGEPSPDTVEQDISAPRAPVQPVPEEISRAEFIIALRKVLKIQEGDVFALLSQLPKGETQEDARDLWEHARTFKRHNRFLLLLATNEGITADQLDEVFRVGHSLDLD